MNLKIFTIIFIPALCFLLVSVYANTDSLEKDLTSMRNDTSKVNLLNKISKKYREIEAETGLKYAHKALEISVNLNYSRGIAESYKNIGLNYWRLGTYDRALDFDLKAVTEFEKIDDTIGIVTTYNNIGLIYLAQSQFAKAIDYLNRSILLSKKNGYSLEIARSQLNLGIIYAENNKFAPALDYHFKSLEESYKVNDSILIPSNYCYIGKIFIRTEQYDSAYKYLTESMVLFKKLNSLNDIAIVKNQFALYYNKLGKFNKSLEFSKSAYDMGSSIGNKYMLMEALGLMCESYAGLNNYKEAYKYHVMYKAEQDTMQNEDNIRNIAQKEMQYEYDKKMRIMEIARQNELFKNNFKFKIAYVFAAVLLVVIALILVFLREKLKANKILSDKNNEIQNQKNELAELNSELYSLNNTKDKFFSIIAHDLKNPLGNFRNITILLANSYDDLEVSDKKEFLELMKDSASNLYSLLENLLEWSRSQQGKIKFNPIEFDMAASIETTVELMQLTADNKQITLKSSVNIGTKITADVNMFSTIIRNLVSNAIKYTPRGGTVEIGTIEPYQGGVYIKDNGIGMNDVLLKNLFRIDSNISRPGTEKEPSTGLGLILCKEFVDRHGGKIWAESEIGKGSTFYFTLSDKS